MHTYIKPYVITSLSLINPINLYKSTSNEPVNKSSHFIPITQRDCRVIINRQKLLLTSFFLPRCVYVWVFFRRQPVYFLCAHPASLTRSINRAQDVLSWKELFMTKQTKIVSGSARCLAYFKQLKLRDNKISGYTDI